MTLVLQGSDTLASTSGTSTGQAAEQNVFLAAAAAGPQNLTAMSYSPFASVDGSWTTPTPYDPSLMAAFGFTGTGMMSGQALTAANSAGFYFPGTTADLTAAGIWGQDSTAAAAANSLMLNSFMLNPLIEQPSTEVMALEGNIAAVNTIDPMMGLGQAFSGINMNGTVPSVIQMGGAGGGGGGGGGTGTSGVGGSGQTVTAAALGKTGTLADTQTVTSSITAGAVSSQGQNMAPQPEKPKSWAAIASQPAKPRPPPPPKVLPQLEAVGEVLSSVSRKSGSTGGRGNVNNGQSSGGGGSRNQGQSSGGPSKGASSRKAQQSHGIQNVDSSGSSGGSKTSKSASSSSSSHHQSELVGKLKSEKNPTEMTINTTNARFFVIKSYAEDDIHRSIKYNIWTSTEHGNRRLDQAFRDQKGKGGVYLFFSVNGSGHFCGVAQMVSEVDFNTVTGVWAQDKWKGRFEVKWIYVKDVPNSQLRHIRLENNENKPVTNSRDTQEVPLAKAKQVIKIMHSYQHTTSIFDDFDHYEKRQEEEDKKVSN